MAAVASSACVDRIGETAGEVWQVLAANGPLSVTRLIKETGGPRDTVMQAVGWLAREGKVNIEEHRRSRTVSLR